MCVCVRVCVCVCVCACVRKDVIPHKINSCFQSVFSLMTLLVGTVFDLTQCMPLHGDH